MLEATIWINDTVQMKMCQKLPVKQCALYHVPLCQCVHGGEGTIELSNKASWSRMVLFLVCSLSEVDPFHPFGKMDGTHRVYSRVKLSEWCYTHYRGLLYTIDVYITVKEKLVTRTTTGIIWRNNFKGERKLPQNTSKHTFKIMLQQKCMAKTQQVITYFV